MRVLTLAALAWLAADVATAQAAEPILSGEGSWNLRKSIDPTTNTPACVMTPKQRSRVQVERDRLVVTGLPRRSIFNFQYRIDDEPASTPISPTDAMQDTGAVSLEGAVFDRILSGKRFRIRILDTWHEAVTEDVDLAGLGGLHRTMIEACR